MRTMSARRWRRGRRLVGGFLLSKMKLMSIVETQDYSEADETMKRKRTNAKRKEAGNGWRRNWKQFTTL